MKPHFFGGDDSPLYGVYDEPRTNVAGAPAVLACYPIAGEYMRAHRAFRQLTNLLSRGGSHVMRFDYYGTGDSLGEASETGVQLWCDNIASAVEELLLLSGEEKVKMVGLRFGATLGLLTAERLDAVDHIVLWDPIVDGRGYVSELESKHGAEQAERGGDPGTDGMIGVNGFGLPRSLRDEIAAIDLTAWNASRPARVDLVVSSETASWTALRHHLGTLPNGGRYEVRESEGNWSDADEFGSALIPQQIIQGVVECVMEEGS